MDSNTLPPIAHLEAIEPAPKERHWIFLLITTAIAAVLLAAMTLHYGLAELKVAAKDGADALIQSPSVVELAPTGMASRGLGQIHDATRVRACKGADCADVSRGGESHRAWDALSPSVCGDAQLWDATAPVTITVCMGIGDIVDAIARDLLVLLIAQGAGLALWGLSHRRHAARIRHWQEQLARAASTDAATGLLNRAGLQAVLRERLVRPQQWSAN